MGGRTPSSAYCSATVQTGRGSSAARPVHLHPARATVPWARAVAQAPPGPALARSSATATQIAAKVTGLAVSPGQDSIDASTGGRGACVPPAPSPAVRLLLRATPFPRPCCGPAALPVGRGRPRGLPVRARGGPRRAECTVAGCVRGGGDGSLSPTPGGAQSQTRPRVRGPKAGWGGDRGDHGRGGSAPE